MQSNHQQSVATESSQTVAMMQVTAVQHGVVTVTGQRQGGCSSCQQRSQCPSGAFASNAEVTVDVPTNELFHIGDKVAVSCSHQQMLTAFALLFGLPLLGMLLMPFALELFTHAIAKQHNGIICLEALLGLGLGLMVGRYKSQQQGWQINVSQAP